MLTNQKTLHSYVRGRPVLRYSDLNERVIKWIINKRKEGACIGGNDIQVFALTVANEIGGETQESFRASNEWLCSLLKRNRLILRYVIII